MHRQIKVYEGRGAAFKIINFVVHNK